MKKVNTILVVSFLLGMIPAVSGQPLLEPASVIPLYVSATYWIINKEKQVEAQKAA
jgi:hypothetical protein